MFILFILLCVFVIFSDSQNVINQEEIRSDSLNFHAQTHQDGKSHYKQPQLVKAGKPA